MGEIDQKHYPVMLKEVISLLPSQEKGVLFDSTAGGGGHLSAMLLKKPAWIGHGVDRDPRAIQRVEQRLSEKKLLERAKLHFGRFSQEPQGLPGLDFALADLGVSSFQLDPQQSGMSLHSKLAPEFRMNPEEGLSFRQWLGGISRLDLEDVLYRYAEEPKAKPLAEALKKAGESELESSASLASFISRVLSYSSSRIHPATRVFQAFRMAQNEELQEIDRLLSWLPEKLNPGGVLVVISFHSLEDRIAKKRFQRLAQSEGFDILTKKPLLPDPEEVMENPASRSAKLRAIKRK